MCINKISFWIIVVYFIVSWYLCSIIIGLLNQYAVILLPSCQIFYQLISILECNLNMTYILNWLNLTVMVTIKTNQSPLQPLVIHQIQFYIKVTRKITLNLQNRVTFENVKLFGMNACREAFNFVCPKSHICFFKL